MKTIVNYGLVLILAVSLFACKKKDNDLVLKTVTVQLVYPSESEFAANSGVTVNLKSNVGSYDANTDATGKATFSVPLGVYDISVTDKRNNGVQSFVYNGLSSNVTVGSTWDGTQVLTLNLVQSKSSQIVIKEIFVGGTPKDDGSGSFAFDKYLILYNNSDANADLSKLCLGMIAPFNAQASNDYYNGEGKLFYEEEKWIPAVQAFWYFQTNVILQPGKQIVIALNNAVNNTVTYSKSINFDNAEYYATYDLSAFTSASYYVAPAASIPSSHYLKAYKYATAVAWALSVTSPGAFIFEPQNTTPAEFAADASLTHVLSAAYTSKKVPFEWVVDGVEGYLLGNANNKKRFPSAIDAGYVYHTNHQGYSLYRNVDKAATEAIEGNTGKLVYNYSLGTTSIGAGGTTDPSNIDAEASIKNGARIVYLDNNNSTQDFHLRSKASLTTN